MMWALKIFFKTRFSKANDRCSNVITKDLSMHVIFLSAEWGEFDWFILSVNLRHFTQRKILLNTDMKIAVYSRLRTASYLAVRRREYTGDFQVRIQQYFTTCHLLKTLRCETTIFLLISEYYKAMPSPCTRMYRTSYSAAFHSLNLISLFSVLE